MSPNAVQSIGSGMRVIRNLPSIASRTQSWDLVIREIDEPFWTACIEVCDTPRKNFRVCAIVTPGIGKSASIHYLIRMLLLQNKTVVYHLCTKRAASWIYEFTTQPENTAQPYLCKVYKETQYPGPETIPSLGDRSTYYIVDPGDTKDSCLPDADFRPRLIIVSAPDPRHWGETEFVKRRQDRVRVDGGRFLYYPLWSLEELIHAKKHMMSISSEDLSDEEIEWRFTQFGGVPRHIFATKCMLKDLLDDQQQAIESLSQETAKQITRGHCSIIAMFGPGSPRSALVGYERVPNKPFTTCTTRLLSGRISKQVYKKSLGYLLRTDTSAQEMYKSLEQDLAIYTMIGDKVEMRTRTCVGQSDAEYNETFLSKLGGCQRMEHVSDVFASAKQNEKVLYFPLSRYAPLIDFIYSEMDSQGKMHFHAFLVANCFTHEVKERFIEQLEAQLGFENLQCTNLYYLVHPYCIAFLSLKQIQRNPKATCICST